MESHISIQMDNTRPSSVKGSPDTSQHEYPEKQKPVQQSCMLDKAPTPVYRHAAPSGPWPWMDFDEDFPIVSPSPSAQEGSEAKSWHEYPQCSFPNWTASQVGRCEMLTACPVGESRVYKVDVFHDGEFDEEGTRLAVIDDKQSEADFWGLLNRPRDERVRVRALFAKNMTKEVLQMLGTRYNVEPFFFSSSTNWIPSRYQEDLKPEQKTDHITVILPFIRAIDGATVHTSHPHPYPKAQDSLPSSEPSEDEDHLIIDTQAPLYLRSSDKYLVQDLLGIHMVRTVESSTIISYHSNLRSDTAERLHSLIKRTGRSVYWSKIFKGSKDPTCLFLCFLWYSMYEWDEVFEILYAHINYLEQLVLASENIRETRELHIMQAHLLYYRTLLEDFRKSVIFVQETKNPAMQDASVTEEERKQSETILKRETDYLLSEIERLESQRMMQTMRLKNVMDLAFASVNIDDSKSMKELTFATVRDSAAMKQISYLTMVFLPANFMSNVFSMNVVEMNPGGGETLLHYVEGAIGLTVFAMWVAVAMQADSAFFPRDSPMWKRIGWPIFYFFDMCVVMYRKRFGIKWKKT